LIHSGAGDKRHNKLSSRYFKRYIHEQFISNLETVPPDAKVKEGMYKSLAVLPQFN